MRTRENALPRGSTSAKAGTAGNRYSARNYTAPTRRKLPPYGRRLAAVLARPDTWLQYIGTAPDVRHLTLWTLCGPDCWGLARDWNDKTHLFVVAPPGEDPARFDWRLLRDHDPIVIQPVGDVSGEEEQALAAALLRDGVQRVLFCGLRGATRYMAPVVEEVHHAA